MIDRSTAPPPATSRNADAPVASATERSTQSLVSIQAALWRRPGLLARELAWRWLFGIPALLPLGSIAIPALAAQVFGVDVHTLPEPALLLSRLLRPRLSAAPHSVVLLLACLLLGWAVASGIGRTFVLRATMSQVNVRFLPLIALQLLRIVSLAASWLLWFAVVRWAARGNITDLPAGAEPHYVSFAAWLICLSLGSFVLWALWSWILSFATVLVAAEHRSAASALAASLRQGRRLTMQLVEINLVLGIVKLALIVLAMVFSAIPLPFETVMTGTALNAWYAFVAILYLAASDFFQVARLASFHAIQQNLRRQ